MKDLNLSDTSVSDTAQRKMEYLITGGFQLHGLLVQCVVKSLYGIGLKWKLSMISRQDIKDR